MLNTAARQSFINRSRALASQMITASDTFVSLAAELQLSGLMAEPDAGGLGPDDFSSSPIGMGMGNNSGITRDDMLAFYAVMGQVLGPLTNDQKAAIYRIRSAISTGMGGV